MSDPTDVVLEAAERLRSAQDRRAPCPPVRDLLPRGSVEAAYAVQRANVDIELAAGRRVAGWKVGLTSSSVQQQLGVDRPDFGVLFADMGYGDGDPVPLDRLLQPRAEAEIAFVLDRDLTTADVGPAEVIRSTAYVQPAIEVVDSRIAGWDIDIVDTVADNASSGLFVVGGTRTALVDVELGEVDMELRRDGEVVSSGRGDACLGHPVNAVVWLANTLAAVGQPLRAGDVVLSGALGPMVPVTEPSSFVASLRGLGSVRAEFVTRAR